MVPYFMANLATPITPAQSSGPLITAARRAAAPRLLTIDALRALAALAVLLHHMPKVYGPLVVLRPLQALGYTGVGLFLVLSGFSIHYRWAAARREEGATFDQRVFWRRRFRRLYPTYAAAALVALLVGAVVLNDVQQPVWAFGGSVPWPAAIASQLLLVPTNFVAPPLLGSVVWTLGLEIQLYAVYALIVRSGRPLNPVKIALAALAVTLLWRIGAQLVTTSTPMGGFLPDGSTSLESRFFFMQVPARCFEWFLGMLAAEIYVRHVRLPAWTRSLVTSAALLGVAAVLARHPVGAATFNGHPFRLSNLILDQLFGLGFFAAVCWLTFNEARFGARVRRPLAGLAYVGLFSYSIYLVHWPAVNVAAWAGVPTGGTAGYLGLTALAAMAVIAAWLFYLAVERRFLRA
jgi:peptidoglycan/LPS O-acetylase OafA/YrhL